MEKKRIVEVKYDAENKRTEKTIENTICISDENGIIEILVFRHYEYEYDNRSEANDCHTRLITFRSPTMGSRISLYRKNKK